MLAHACLAVDLDAIAANFRLLQESVAPAECSAVIKADAYGLGADAIGRRLLAEGCRTFFFAHLSEALQLAPAIHEAGGAVYALNGTGLYPVADFIRAGIIPVLNTLEEARLWTHQANGAQAALHLDTGMNRLGLPACHDEAVLSLKKDGLNLIHVMSHPACADEPDRTENRAQLSRFVRRAELYGNVRKSFANSAACFLGPEYRFDLTRPGLALYGAQPVAGRRIPLSIPYRFEAPVLQVRRISAGEGFGYGATHIAAADGYSATIGAGYADGVPRCLSNRGHVWLGGIKAPIIGRVSMDTFAADISAHPDPQNLVHTAAQIYGPDLPVDVQALSAGLTPYELLTRIGGRTQRIHINELASR